MSGGAGDVDHPIQVARKPTLVPPSLDQLYEAKGREKMHVPLDGADRAVECLGEGCHLRPAET